MLFPQIHMIQPSIECGIDSIDDWKGLTDPVERRRRQNRVNQRLRRKRQRLQNGDDLPTKNVGPRRVAPKRMASRSVTPKSMTPKSTSPESTTPNGEVPKNVIASILSSELMKLKQSAASRKEHCNDSVTPTFARLLLSQFTEDAYQRYIKGSPSVDQLLVLTKINVFRAFCHNLQLIDSSLDSMQDEAISPFNIPSIPISPSSSPERSSIPASLWPTKIQRMVPHHPWLDCFPLPKMRDNLIQAGSNWDERGLCRDIMGFWVSDIEAGGLLVWGEPWDVQNWELTEDFLKKWQWTVRGCPELMNSTNAWRAKRGEKPIFRYI